MTAGLCAPSACGSCPLLGACGDPTDLPPEMHTPEEWGRIVDVLVLDPDGWRRDGKPWNEPLDREEFQARAFQSTIASPRPAWADPDAPDRDPNEPRPEGFGCCGGACSA